MAKGRRPRPTAQHKEAGTYRPENHDHRLDNQSLPGAPEMPEGLTVQQQADWLLIVSDLPDGLLCRLDGGLLIEYVMVSQFLRDCRAQLAEDPTDKDTRIAYTSYFDRWHRLIGELGLSPASRARLSYEPPKDEESNPFADILQRKAKAQ